MNQRIRELAVQSDTYAHNRMAEIGGSYLEYHSEKFAELIVAECEEVVRWAISVDSTIERVPVLIREHFRVDFGVER